MEKSIGPGSKAFPFEFEDGIVTFFGNPVTDGSFGDPGDPDEMLYSILANFVAEQIALADTRKETYA